MAHPSSASRSHRPGTRRSSQFLPMNWGDVSTAAAPHPRIVRASAVTTSAIMLPQCWGRTQRLRQQHGREPMIDSNRRTILTTGAAAAAATAAPQVFAQAPQSGVPQGAPPGAKVGFYEKGNVRIRYAEIGSGFPLLAAPGGGL